MKADLPSTVALSRDSGGCSSAASSSAKWTMILSQRDKERRKTRGSQQSRQIMLPTRALGLLTNRNDKRPDGNFRQGFAGACAAVQESKKKTQVSLPAP